MGFGDSLTVEVGAVGATEVFDMDALRGRRECGVAAGGLGVETKVDAGGFAPGFDGGGDGDSLPGEGAVEGDEGESGLGRCESLRWI